MNYEVICGNHPLPISDWSFLFSGAAPGEDEAATLLQCPHERRQGPLDVLHFISDLYSSASVMWPSSLCVGGFQLSFIIWSSQ
jgi:hypothetical protein